MAGSVKQKQVDELASKTRDALMRSAWFEAERLALKAIGMARQEQDFERMATLIAPLLESRQQRFRTALQTNKIKILQTPITETMKIQRGCYLIQPPNVGLDARRLRLAALTREIPIAVLCREPLSITKQVPIVAISPGATLRVKIDPPAKQDAPSMAWFVGAFEELGDRALEAIDPTLPVTRKIDALMEYLDALPESENLHLALEAACREAAASNEKTSSTPAAKSSSKSSKIKL